MKAGRYIFDGTGQFPYRNILYRNHSLKPEQVDKYISK